MQRRREARANVPPARLTFLAISQGKLTCGIVGTAAAVPGEASPPLSSRDVPDARDSARYGAATK